ncbi:hypothetical protein AB0N05_27010 [Nocardia sp. NPDC051030]|uniref:hypothetical protein n=1 Tax=Nocardia sp. NPDC051030 TaxID=3155162 RepID=UPI00342A00BF
MPSFMHEGLIELFRTQPTLAAWFLTDVFGIPMPEFRGARTDSCDFTDIKPREFREDTALVLIDDAGAPLVGIVVEIQLGKDSTRQWSWPVYISTLRARLQCPTYLLVVSPQPGVAAWCREPIELGHPGLVLRPLVLGPERIPPVTDPEDAAAVPERAVLSAIAHGESRDADAVFTALLVGLHHADDEHAKMYYDLVLTALSDAAQHRLEALMATKYEYQSNFARTYVAEGRAEEAARNLLRFLEFRGAAISSATRDRITTCTDPEQLEAWIDCALAPDFTGELP